MAERLVLMVGDPPISGGQVLPHGSTFMTVNDVPYAYLGGQVQCAGCHSVGVIAKAGGPYRIDHDGKEVALEGDIVLCQCAIPPKLISETIRAMNIEISVDDGIAYYGKASFPLGHPPPELANDFISDNDENYFVIHCHLQHDRTGENLARIPYRITLEDGSEFTGISDENGYTQVVYSATLQRVKLEAPYHVDCDASALSNSQFFSCSC